MVGETLADGDHFPVGGRVAVRPSKIASACKDLTVAHNHGAEREISLASFIEGDPHEPFIVG